MSPNPKQLKHYLERLHDYPKCDTNGIKVACGIFLKGTNRYTKNVFGFNKQIGDLQMPRIHAELNALLQLAYDKGMQYDETPIILSTTVFVNRVPCSYCARSLLYVLGKHKIYFVTENKIPEHQEYHAINALREELKLDIEVYIYEG